MADLAEIGAVSAAVAGGLFIAIKRNIDKKPRSAADAVARELLVFSTAMKDLGDEAKRHNATVETETARHNEAMEAESRRTNESLGKVAEGVANLLTGQAILLDRTKK